MEHLQNHERLMRFFELWVLKESFIKTSGLGFSEQLDRFSFDFNQKDSLHIQLENTTGKQSSDTQSWLYKISDEYRSAITVNSGSACKFNLRFFEIISNGYLRSEKDIRLLRKSNVSQFS